ncbi:MAG: SPOR domain-containing protein [Bacteroidales bacterium]|nr:SPOR domain-containing protein [Bacteroidales bacterium]
MRQIFKQRIVGAVVLVALGVIFLPFLFTLEPPRPIDTASQIPPPPDIERVVVAGPERGEAMAPPKPPEEAFLPQHTVISGESATPVEDGGDLISGREEREQEPARQVGSPAEEKGAEAKGAGERPALAGNTLASWVVQVASVRDQAAANDLRDKLLAAGHKAYVRSAQAGGGTTYRIFVGPMALKERATTDKAAIDKAFGVQSMVVRFEP